MMNETEFILALAKTTKAYKWTVQSNKSLTGTAQNGKDRGNYQVLRGRMKQALGVSVNT